MNSRLSTLRAVLATVVLTASAAGIAAASGSNACDPMYPCAIDPATPAAVYDLSARTESGTSETHTLADTGSTPRLTAAGLGGEQFEDHPDYRDGATQAAVYDLMLRTDTSPCESYPCYLDDAKPAAPMAADAKAADEPTDRRI